MKQPVYQSEYLLDLVFDNNHMPIALMDRDFNFLRVNVAYAVADEKMPEYFIGKNHFELYPNPENERIFRQVVASGEPYFVKAKAFKYKHNPERGVTYWDWSLVPVHYSSNLVGVMLQLVDVTQHIEAKEKLDETAQLLDSIIENVPAMIFVKRASDLAFKYFNRAGEELLGVGREQLLGRNDYDFFPREQADFFTDKDREVLGGHEVFDVPEEKIDTENGTRILHTKKIALCDDQGNPKYLLGISEDITGQKKTDEELQRLALIVKNSSEFIAVSDIEGNVLFLNDAGRRLVGIRDDKHFYSTRVPDYFPEDEREKIIKQVLPLVMKDGRWAGESKFRNFETDQSIPVWFDIFRVDDPRSGKPVNFATVTTDMTERKQAENELETYREKLEKLVEQRTFELEQAQGELIKKERLAVLGQLTATVSHELRNPLSAIWTSVYLLDKHFDGSDPKLEELIARVKRNITHCDSIIDELLDFTNTRDLNLKKTYLDTWLQEIYADFQWNEGVIHTINTNCNGIELPIDKDRLQRAIINVLQNAQQALLVDTNKSKKTPEVAITTSYARGIYEIHVLDNGPGIPQELQSKIFEPLFSTKSFGAGLGMNVIQQVMEQHGGGVKVLSEEGNGAEVILWLPESNVPADHQPC
jgi:PAS domain S-box-containing protein